MKNNHILAFLCLLCVPISVANSQEPATQKNAKQKSVNEKPDGPVYDHLKGLEPFVGKWKGRFDPPGSVPEGDCFVQCRWSNFKTYLHVDVTFSPDNTDLILDPMHIVIGFNGETQTPYSWDFRVTTPLMGITEIGDNAIVQNYEGVDFRGKTHTRLTKFKLRENGELVVTNTKIQRDGEDQADEPILVMRQVVRLIMTPLAANRPGRSCLAASSGF